LHVILCFSPVGEKFRSRALKFPGNHGIKAKYLNILKFSGLISGCTVDWFQPWPKDALVSVASHFLGAADFACSGEARRQLFKSMAQVQESVSQVSHLII